MCYEGNYNSLLSTTDEKTVIEAAMVIRRAVIDGHKESEGLPWPPTNKDLQNGSVNMPVLLINFLETLYSKDGKVKSERCRRRVNSTAQDIMLQRNPWKMDNAQAHFNGNVCSTSYR